MFIKIHDKNQQDDSLGNGTCHQTSQPESNFPNPHGSIKRKLTPVLGLSSDLHKHWHTHTHTPAHTQTQTHMHKHMYTMYTHKHKAHTCTEVWADVNKTDVRYCYLNTIYNKLCISAFKMFFFKQSLPNTSIIKKHSVYTKNIHLRRH